MQPNDDQLSQHHLLDLHTNGTWECVEFLSNSFQRVQVLAALNDAPAGLCDLKNELAIPRTSLQRNLSLLEQHGWIKQISPEYTTTTRGDFIINVFLEMLDRIQRIETLTPFLDEVNLPTEIDINRFNVSLVTVPMPHRPYGHITRLFDIFETAEQIRAFLPSVSGLLAKRYYRSSKIIGEHEFILSKNTFDAHYREGTDEWRDMAATASDTLIDLCVYDGELPYGLFVCGDKLALAAYDDLGRMTALVESDSMATIEWGEGIYERYKKQSNPLREFH